MYVFSETNLIKDNQFYQKNLLSTREILSQKSYKIKDLKTKVKTRTRWLVKVFFTKSPLRPHTAPPTVGPHLTHHIAGLWLVLDGHPPLMQAVDVEARRGELLVRGLGPVQYTLYYTILYTVLYYTLYYTILYTVLYYTLYYTILYYILYYTIHYTILHTVLS